MSRVNIRLTVYFEEPFWVGVFEVSEGGKLSATKVNFGAEPKGVEVYDNVLNHYYDLNFSPAVESAERDEKKNPKRMQREVRKQLINVKIGTKSQQALKLMQENNKLERKTKSRQQKEAEAKLKFEQKQKKKKEKHRGR